MDIIGSFGGFLGKHFNILKNNKWSIYPAFSIWPKSQGIHTVEGGKFSSVEVLQLVNGEGTLEVDQHSSASADESVGLGSDRQWPVKSWKEKPQPFYTS